MDTTPSLTIDYGQKRDVYPGAALITSPQSLPTFHGGVVMYIQSSGNVMWINASTALSEITVDPEFRGGVPTVGSGRWPIAHILEKLASGITTEQLLQEYPGLTLADVQLALEAAAWVMRDPAIDWAELNVPGMVDFQREMWAWQSLNDAEGLTDSPSRD